MVCPRVQRSGRTSIRATTRSFPASVNVTPFNSAKGIFIELTFSSGVMIGSPPVFLQLSYAGLTKPGNDFSGSGHGDNWSIIRHTSVMHQFPPRRLVCLTEETVETLYLLGEQDRILGVSRSA